MGKRMEETKARQRDWAQARGQILQTPTETTQPELEKDPVIEKNVETCGQSPCCAYLAAPELLTGQAYQFKSAFKRAMPMPCGGTNWIPRPDLLRKRRRESFPPSGLQQFEKK